MCCGRLKCLSIYMGQTLSLTWFKLRILRLTMNRKNLLQLFIQTSFCVYKWKPMLGDKIIFACAVLIYMSHYLEKAKEKLSLRISPKCWCAPIVVMLPNELGDGIAVDTSWFRMFWQHSNTIYGKIGMWLKKWNLGEGTRCEEGVNIGSQNLCGIWRGEYQLEVHEGDGS